MVNSERVYETNPSLYEVGKDIYEKGQTIRYLPPRRGVFHGNSVEIHREERIRVYDDTRQYFKLFKAGVMAYAFLSKGSREVLGYILNSMNYGDDKFYFLVKECKKVVDLSDTSIQVALRQLLEEEWIYKSSNRYWYWINIGFIAYGPVEKKIKEAIEIKR